MEPVKQQLAYSFLDHPDRISYILTLIELKSIMCYVLSVISYSLLVLEK